MKHWAAIILLAMTGPVLCESSSLISELRDGERVLIEFQAVSGFSVDAFRLEFVRTGDRWHLTCTADRARSSSSLQLGVASRELSREEVSIWDAAIRPRVWTDDEIRLSGSEELQIHWEDREEQFSRPGDDRFTWLVLDLYRETEKGTANQTPDRTRFHAAGNSGSPPRA